jgi:hypothetical protein
VFNVEQWHCRAALPHPRRRYSQVQTPQLGTARCGGCAWATTGGDRYDVAMRAEARLYKLDLCSTPPLSGIPHGPFPARVSCSLRRPRFSLNPFNDPAYLAQAAWYFGGLGILVGSCSVDSAACVRSCSHFDMPTVQANNP